MNYKFIDKNKDSDDSLDEYDYMEFKNLINLKEIDKSAYNINGRKKQNNKLNIEIWMEEYCGKKNKYL